MPSLSYRFLTGNSVYLDKINYQVVGFHAECEEHNKLSESQAGFRFGCSCVDIYLL